MAELAYKEARYILRENHRCCKTQGKLICLESTTMQGHICDWLDGDKVVHQGTLVAMLLELYDKEEKGKALVHTDALYLCDRIARRYGDQYHLETLKAKRHEQASSSGSTGQDQDPTGEGEESSLRGS